MAKLTSGQRNALPSSTFAGPHRSFPIPDASHARNALARAHFAPDPSAIEAAVHRKFPSIGSRAFGGPVSPHKPYLVGERGPELMMPRSHGTILPSPARMAGAPRISQDAIFHSLLSGLAQRK